MEPHILAAIIAACVGLVGILTAVAFAVVVLNSSKGFGRMVEIADDIAKGAAAFLQREYIFLACFIFVTTIVLVVINTDANWVGVGVCFLLGAATSGLTGYVGMSIAVRANVRTTEAAKTSLNAALRVAFLSGSVMGLSVVGWGLFMLSVLYLIFKGDMTAVAGFSMGASSIALFARVGGGIFTKAADVGADLVGKVEQNIPEDDPRNPATIADNVGDNVGDVAGMGADLFESYVGSMIGAIYLARNDAEISVVFWVAAIGLLSSIIGCLLVRTSETNARAADIQNKLLRSIRFGIIVASVLVLAGTVTVTAILGRIELTYIVAIGIVSGILIGFFTEFSTSYAYQPTLSIANAGVTGPATVIIQGLGVGQLSTLPPIFIICVATLSCLYLADGTYGVALAGVGMLSTLGVTLATDAYGPVADNAGGIAEMAELDEIVRERTDQLDALGNTTAATGKGFAIGSAVLTALALMQAYVESAGVTSLDLLSSYQIVPGLLFGAMMPFLFSALTMLAVGKSAGFMIQEVRRQFRDIDGLLEGNAVADHVACVKIATTAALREMVLPGVLAVTTPVLVGLGFGPEALAGMLLGAISSGALLAIMMANAGGAWDNAKKYVEAGNIGGKGTLTHSAMVTGDTVGDPFKDTSGPALNILIKLMSVVSLVFARLFKVPRGYILPRHYWVAIILAVVLVIFVVAWWTYLDRVNASNRIEFAVAAARAGNDEENPRQNLRNRSSSTESATSGDSSSESDRKSKKSKKGKGKANRKAPPPPSSSGSDSYSNQV